MKEHIRHIQVRKAVQSDKIHTALEAFELCDALLCMIVRRRRESEGDDAIRGTERWETW